MVVGEYYHLYSRGVDKRKIFLNGQDYRKFLFLMYVCNSEKSIVSRDLGKKFERGETIVDVGAYCLMPNHFHILVREKTEGGISKYLKKLLTGYSMYFNLKNHRQGKLFDGNFRSELVTGDRYLKYLYSYIHLNPAKLIDVKWKENTQRDNAKLMAYCSTYPYSSLNEYKNARSKITNPGEFPNYFVKLADHQKELASWLSFTP